jgi:hypothetical protein
MSIKTTIILAGLTAALGAGAAFAQPAPEGAPYQQAPYQQAPNQQGPGQTHRHLHGVFALIKDEMSAGRLSHKEGSLLVQKIRELHAERRAQREARYSEEGAPPAQGQMQQPH